jgi:acyl-CoA thioesterase
VWTAKLLEKKCDIDHSMPFARWPNNDLWNLLPTDSPINNQKSDRLPSELKLKAAKERIQHWWQMAWLEQNAPPDQYSSTFQKVKDTPSASLIRGQSQRFFVEANIVLLGLSSDNSSVDDLSEALVMQRGRLKEIQQLREW